MRPEAKGESGAAAVRVAGVTKLFGEVAAVDDVDLDIGHGEFFSLLGPSGCGKTTLLRLIGGFELPDAGTIAIGGRDLTEHNHNPKPFVWTTDPDTIIAAARRGYQVWDSIH